MLAILQFDAASAGALARLEGEGRLPTLGAVRRAGHAIRLETAPLDLFPSAVYPSLYTGRPVQEHGIYSAFPWVADEQRLRYMHELPLPKTVWEALSPARRSLVVDPYDNWRPQRLNGGCINGWQYRNRVAALERWSVPASLQRTLERQLGRAPLVEDTYGAQPARRLLRIRERLLAAPARIAGAAELLLPGGGYDLFWATFAAAHFAGHFLWDTSQIAEELDDATRGALEETVAQVYEAVDAAFARILAVLPDGADVIVLSPIGMGPYTSKADLLPDMLQAVLAGRAERAPEGTLTAVRAAIPGSLRAAVAGALPTRAVRELSARLALLRMNWTATRAFVCPGERNGYIRFNVAGRERDGIVAPAEVAALAAEICAGLASFRAEDGAPIVADVVRIDGELRDASGLLPDLVVLWSDTPSAGLHWAASPRFGTVERRGTTGLSGHHTADAWALLLPGSSRVAELGRPAHLLDIAATAHGLLGDPSGLPGTPLLVL